MMLACLCESQSFMCPSTIKTPNRIAEAMAGAIGAELLTISQARELEFPGWDVLGLGSGIFFGKHHRQLLEFAEQSPGDPQRMFRIFISGYTLSLPALASTARPCASKAWLSNSWSILFAGLGYRWSASVSGRHSSRTSECKRSRTSS